MTAFALILFGVLTLPLRLVSLAISLTKTSLANGSMGLKPSLTPSSTQKTNAVFIFIYKKKEFTFKRKYLVKSKNAIFFEAAKDDWVVKQTDERKKNYNLLFNT